MTIAKKIFTTMSLTIPFFSHANASENSFLNTLEKVLQNHPELEKSKAAVAIAESSNTLARGALLPRTSASVYTGYSQDLAATTGAIPANATLESDWTLINASARAKKQAAEKTLESVQFEKKAAEQNLLLRAALAYVALQEARETAFITRELAQATELYLKSTQKRLRIGDAASTDVQRVEVRFARARSQEIETTEELALREREYTIKTSQEPPSQTPIPKIVEKNLTNRTSTEETPAEKAAQARVQAANSELQSAELAYLPVGSINARYSKTWSLYGNIDNDEHSISAGVKVSVPLDTNQTLKGNVEQSVAKHSAATADLRIIQESKNAEIKLSKERLQKTLSSQIEKEKAQKSANAAFSGILQQYKMSSSTIMDVLDAQEDVLNLNIAVVKGRANIARRALEWLAAQGRLTIPALRETFGGAE
jgi:outer membrane protein TolC